MRSLSELVTSRHQQTKQNTQVDKQWGVAWRSGFLKQLKTSFTQSNLANHIAKI